MLGFLLKRTAFSAVQELRRQVEVEVVRGDKSFYAAQDDIPKQRSANLTIAGQINIQPLKMKSDLVPRDGSWPVPPLCVNGNKHPKSCVHIARDLPDFRNLPQRPLSPAVTFYKQSVSHMSNTHIVTSLTLSLTGVKF